MGDYFEFITYKRNISIHFLVVNKGEKQVKDFIEIKVILTNLPYTTKR